jgi:hypothetical protein
MNTQLSTSRPTRTAVFGFLAIIGCMAAVAASTRLGMIDANAARRFLGILIGVMLLWIGNSLPKLRPLMVPHDLRSRAIGSERIAGWISVLAGLAYTALFIFASLAQARKLSAIIGLVAAAMVLVNWLWLALAAYNYRRKAGLPREPAAPRRTLTSYLLFACFYLLITACIAFLEPPSAAATSWNTISWLLFAGMFAALGSRRRLPR